MTHNDVVASWQQLLCHEGDLPELGSVSLVINKRMAELWQLRDTKSAVSEDPRAFPGQLIGYVRVNVSPKWEDRHLWYLSSEWVGVEAWFVGEWVTIRGWVTGWIKSKSPYLNPWRHGVRKSGNRAGSRGVSRLLVHNIEAMGETTVVWRRKIHSHSILRHISWAALVLLGLVMNGRIWLVTCVVSGVWLGRGKWPSRGFMRSLFQMSWKCS